jgi:protoporphyrinogen oxidase
MTTGVEVRTADDPVVVVGAGPAGLTAARELDRAGVDFVVLEMDGTVGGLSRTVRHGGYRFDIGGHRFLTKVPAVEEMWREVLGSELVRRDRRSRILYRGRYLDYPLRIGTVLRALGPAFAARAILSFAAARAAPRIPERSMEDWVTNRFGAYLYRTFFKTYTEKVWGLPCAEIGAEWAAQRIRGLSFGRAVAAMLPGGTRGIKSLAEAFHYPRLGPGQMWEAVAARLSAPGRLRLGAEVVAVHHRGGLVHAVTSRDAEGETTTAASHLVSSMPLRALVEALDPPPPAAVLEAARALRYRDFVTVALVVDRPALFPDQWLYIHDPALRVGRIQNYGNWSPDLVGEPERTLLGLEYFCFEGDGLWTLPDEEMVALARGEVETLGLARGAAVREGVVVRMRHAYPVYDRGHVERLAVIRAWLERLGNLHPVGRNGLHRYNNQDHSMLTAMLAVRNILGERHDVWSVNADCEYLEEAHPELRAAAPGRVSAPPPLLEPAA